MSDMRRWAGSLMSTGVLPYGECGGFCPKFHQFMAKPTNWIDVCFLPLIIPASHGRYNLLVGLDFSLVGLVWS
jgi:hypothetical protein